MLISKKQREQRELLVATIRWLSLAALGLGIYIWSWQLVL